MAAAIQAVEDSKFISAPNFNPDKAGVIWGSGIGGLQTFIDEMVGFANGDGTPRFNPFFIPKMIIDIAAGHISMKYGLRGPNYATVSACASSTNAMIDSHMLISMGKAEIIVAGVNSYTY